MPAYAGLGGSSTDDYEPAGAPRLTFSDDDISDLGGSSFESSVTRTGTDVAGPGAGSGSSTTIQDNLAGIEAARAAAVPNERTIGATTTAPGTGGQTTPSAAAGNTPGAAVSSQNRTRSTTAAAAPRPMVCTVDAQGGGDLKCEEGQTGGGGGFLSSLLSSPQGQVFLTAAAAGGGAGGLAALLGGGGSSGLTGGALNDALAASTRGDNSALSRLLGQGEDSLGSFASGGAADLGSLFDGEIWSDALGDTMAGRAFDNVSSFFSSDALGDDWSIAGIDIGDFSLGGALNDFGEWAGSAIDGVVDGLGSFAQGAWDAVPEWSDVTAAFGFSGSTTGSLADLADSSFFSGSDWSVAGIDVGDFSIGGAFNDFSEWAGDAFSGVTDGFGEIGASIGQGIGEIGNSISSGLGSIGASISDAFSGGGGSSGSGSSGGGYSGGDSDFNDADR